MEIHPMHLFMFIFSQNFLYINIYIISLKSYKPRTTYFNFFFNQMYLIYIFISNISLHCSNLNLIHMIFFNISDHCNRTEKHINLIADVNILTQTIELVITVQISVIQNFIHYHYEMDNVLLNHDNIHYQYYPYHYNSSQYILMLYLL